MLRRSAVILALAALFTNLFLASIPSAHASVTSFAQEDTSENTQEGEEEGSESSEAEVGSNEGQAETTEEEAGAPWTYQMARMAVILVVVMGLSIALMYWRLVVKRQREGI